MNGAYNPHHVTANAVSGLQGRGITINLRHELHESTRTYCRQIERAPTTRGELGRDLKDIRVILRREGYDRTVVNRQLRELTRQNFTTMGGP
jgi:hypothetical protein